VAVDWQGQEPMVRVRNAEATTHTTTSINHTRQFKVSIHQMAPPVRGSKHPIQLTTQIIDLERMKG